MSILLGAKLLRGEGRGRNFQKNALRERVHDPNVYIILTLF